MYGPNLVHDLPPFDEQRNLRVVVETPRGANIKIKFDEKLGFFCLSRVLPLGVTYPYDFGFVPQTLAQDGDPLDAVVLIDAMTYPGVVISCRLLGALQVEERGLRGRPNHRLVAVPVKAARREELRNFADLGKRMQQELERFFVMSSAFTSKDPVVRGWVGPDAATDMVQRSINRYRERSPSRTPRGETAPAASATSRPAPVEAGPPPLVSAPIDAPPSAADEPDKAESA
jgi:inorganic pyrophosphatase